jgi:hypothetical protein
VDEKAVRYRLGRIASRARDRRADQVSSVTPYREAIAEWMRSRAAERGMNGCQATSGTDPLATSKTDPLSGS